jgi:hypothetical protein
MKSKEFNGLTDAQLERVQHVLATRGLAFAADEADQLHDLKKSADLQGITYREAMAGFMAERTVKLYGMMHDDLVWSMDAWEKMIDEQMADLILLNAVVKEEELERKGLNDLPALDDPPDNPDVKTAGELDPGEPQISPGIDELVQPHS